MGQLISKLVGNLWDIDIKNSAVSLINHTGCNHNHNPIAIILSRSRSAPKRSSMFLQASTETSRHFRTQRDFGSTPEFRCGPTPPSAAGTTTRTSCPPTTSSSRTPAACRPASSGSTGWQSSRSFWPYALYQPCPKQGGALEAF